MSQAEFSKARDEAIELYQHEQTKNKLIFYNHITLEMKQGFVAGANWCMEWLAKSEDAAYIRDHLERYDPNPDRAMEVFNRLFGKETE